LIPFSLNAFCTAIKGARRIIDCLPGFAVNAALMLNVADSFTLEGLDELPRVHIWVDRVDGSADS
jgi:hypothetical protein